MTDETRFRIRDGTLGTEVEGETVLVDTATGMYFGLDPVGTVVWRHLQEQRPLGEMREAMLREFDVAPERLQADLEELLAALQEHRLIEPA